MISKLLFFYSTLFCIAYSNPVNYNLSLVSNTMYQNDNNDFGISDVWGYTDETGIEYAIFGYRYGTIILDVSSDPSAPMEKMNLIGPSNNDYYYHRDYKVYNDFLYIVNEMTGSDIGMQVVDLSPFIVLLLSVSFTSDVSSSTYFFTRSGEIKSFLIQLCICPLYIVAVKVLDLPTSICLT